MLRKTLIEVIRKVSFLVDISIVVFAEVNQIQYSTKEVEKALKNPEVAASEIKKLIGGVVERLQALKRKANESISDEIQASYICKRKLQHLQEIASADNSEAVVDQWKRVSVTITSFPTLFIVKVHRMRIQVVIRTIFCLKSYTSQADSS